MSIISLDKDGEPRKCTNVPWIFVCIGFIATLLILVSICGTNSRISVITHGYDDCGNVCGDENKNSINLICGATDKSDKSKLLVKRESLECVSSCDSDYLDIFNRCFKLNETYLEPVDSFTRDVSLSKTSILITLTVTLVLSYIFLLALRYISGIIIWLSYISIIVLLGIAAITFFVLYATTEEIEKSETTDDSRRFLLMMAIFLTIPTLLCASILFFFRKRINLVAKLFQEAGKALTCIPHLFLQPLLTLTVTMISVVPFAFFWLIIESSSTLKPESECTDKAFLEDSPLTYATRIFNFIAFLWFTQFLMGCQHFIIAGTVSKWYFTRNKDKLEAPMSLSYKDLIHFHLGSICLGSWIITTIKIIKIFLFALKYSFMRSRYYYLRIIGYVICYIIERLTSLLEFLVRNAYIIVAKDGAPFVKAGGRAFDLIVRNAIDIIALNHFGDLALFVIRLVITVLSGAVGYSMMVSIPGVQSVVLPLLITLLISFYFAHCLITVFEMTVDTIFLCYCEDIEENDGSAMKPYFMSPELMDIVENMKNYSRNNIRYRILVAERDEA